MYWAEEIHKLTSAGVGRGEYGREMWRRDRSLDALSCSMRLGNWCQVPAGRWWTLDAEYAYALGQKATSECKNCHGLDFHISLFSFYFKRREDETERE